jgi:TP53 regulating kinase-like protein
MPPKKQQSNESSATTTEEEKQPTTTNFGLTLGAILHQCAESHVLDATFCGSPAIIKIRIKKDYRHQVLDERIRVQRMQREARALAKAAKFGVPVPTVYCCDKNDCSIVMEKVIGCTVREVFEVVTSIFPSTPTSPTSSASSLPSCSTSDILRASCAEPSKIIVKSMEVDESFFFPDDNKKVYTSAAECVCDIVCNRILFQMGRIIAKLHSFNCMHGDLTTSNFMVRNMNKALLRETISKNLQNVNALQQSLEELFSQQQQKEHNNNILEVVVIDFGLVQESSALEERAVDLYVLERAILSTHPTMSNAGQVIIEGYAAQVRQLEIVLEKDQAKAREQGSGLGGRPNKQSANATSVLERLEAVRARGKKTSMIG